MRDYRLYLTDIRESIEKINAYIAGMDLTSFSQDSKTFESVLYNIQIIGEAANRIPEEIRERHPGIDRRGIIGMRNVIVHGYFSIDPETVWKTVHESIPRLRVQITDIR